MKYHSLLFATGLFVLTTASSFGYGEEGHSTIGGIAAERLSGTPTAAKIKDLLDGVPLYFAATIPDRIKSWDKNSDADDPHGFKMPEHPGIEAQLRAFWAANRPGDGNDDSHPSHHWFHYTDVPLAGNEKYADGKAGRSQWDIVHMINFCCRVLTGEESEQNARAITKPVAIILLAHYVGDIHQPLHVGAEYFDNGHIANPDTDPKALSDEGGNSFFLTLTTPSTTDPSAIRRRPKLHGYWDSATVKLLIEQVAAEIKKANPGHGPDVPPAEFTHWLAQQEPPNWKPAPTLLLKDWAESWANEILPIAREAHDRLLFTQFKQESYKGKPVVSGVAVEKAGMKPSYAEWSAAVVRVELKKGGYRLAAMLEQVLK